MRLRPIGEGPDIHCHGDDSAIQNIGSGNTAHEDNRYLGMLYKRRGTVH